MDKNQFIGYAHKAYEDVYNNSEDFIVREAISRYSDSEDVTDYVESYMKIFKEGWVNYVAFRGALKTHLDDNDNLAYYDLDELLADDFQIAQITNDKIGTTYKYLRPKKGHEGDDIPSEPIQVKTFPELSEQEKKRIVNEIRKSASSFDGHWISMVDLGASLKTAQIDYKTMGFPKLRILLDQLSDYIELRVESPVKIYVHVIGDDATVSLGEKTVVNSISSDVEKWVVDAIKFLVNDGKTYGEGWVNSVLLAPVIKNAGVDYKALGFEKFKLFLESFSFLQLNQISQTELHIRINPNPKIVFPPKENVSKSENLSPYQRIVRYAYFPSKDKETNGFTSMLQELEAKAKKETWEYGNQKILQNYLLYTFERIQYEDSRIKSVKEEPKRKLREGSEYAVFNTGLVNSFFSPIYGLFRRNPQKGKQKWLFSGFHVESEKAISNAKKEENWDDLPKAARFYETPDDLIFDVESKIDAINWEHIIIDNVDRIPFKYIEMYKPLGLDLEKEPNEPMIYYQNLRYAIRNDQFTYRKLVDLFRNAMDRAVLHATWNFHYALPMYYPRYRKVSMLLPLVLEDNRDSIVELALVLDRDNKHKSYTATTIMTLEQIYCNIRLISQPDEDTYWLHS
ncbi:MAG: DUF3825 domain-containing protein [Bacteroidales bacterium]|nr:DUF3825 domain-containing protein [Bacteroidales bacterium]